LKPGAFKLWVNWMQPVQPHLDDGLEQQVVVHRLRHNLRNLDVAVQVAFERQNGLIGRTVSLDR
jgi:hypothetical protein